MKKLFAVLTLLLVMIFGIGAPQTAQAAFDEKSVGFVVIDKSGNLDAHTYKEWRTGTKWAYLFPDYKIVENGVPQEVVGSVLSKKIKVDNALLKALADESKVDVLVIVKVYDMNDTVVSGFSSREDDGPFVLVELSADMYVYKKDGDKLLKQRFREREIKDMGNYERPQETIKWALANLVNKMEGRPKI